MFNPFRMISSPFLPSTRIEDDFSGYRSMLDTPPMEEDPSYGRGSLLDRYNEIVNKRPYQEAFAKMLTDAPRREDYKPGKVSKLAAALSGFGAGVRQGPGAGIEASRSILDRGYNQATEQHNQNLKKTSMLADLEERDLDRQLKGINLEHTLEKEGYDRRYKEGRDKKEDAQKLIDNAARQKQLEQQGWIHYTNDETGETVAYNQNTKEKVTLDKTQMTREQKVASERSDAKFKNDLNRNTQLTVENQRHKNDMAEIDSRNKAALALQDKKNVAKAAEVKAKLEAKPPNVKEQFGQLYAEITRQVAADPELADYFDLSGDYPKVYQPWGADAIKLQKAQEILKNLGQGKGNVNNQSPGADNLPTGWSRSGGS